MLWSEVNLISDIFIVGYWRAGLDLDRLEIALNRHPANQALEFIDCILILGIDYNLEAIDLLHTDRITHISHGQLDLLGRLAYGCWYVVFREECFDLERLINSVALFLNQTRQTCN